MLLPVTVNSIYSKIHVNTLNFIERLDAYLTHLPKVLFVSLKYLTLQFVQKIILAPHENSILV